MRKIAKYTVSDDEILEDKPLPREWVIEGNPVAKGKIISESEDKRLETGVWECDVGSFKWEYDCDEVCYLIAGACRIESDSDVKELTAGDLAHFRKGLKSRWTITKRVKKIYILYR